MKRELNETKAELKDMSVKRIVDISQDTKVTVRAIPLTQEAKLMQIQCQKCFAGFRLIIPDGLELKPEFVCGGKSDDVQKNNENTN